VDAEELRERFSHNPERGVQVPSSGLVRRSSWWSLAMMMWHRCHAFFDSCCFDSCSLWDCHVAVAKANVEGNT